MLDDAVMRLLRCFSRSCILPGGEFLAYNSVSGGCNDYFSLRDCATEKDLQCKVLEWFSRPAYKSEPFRSDKKNAEYHAYMLDGINRFLGTRFTPEIIEEIYSKMGNACNHERTKEFVASGYDLNLLFDIQ